MSELIRELKRRGSHAALRDSSGNYWSGEQVLSSAGRVAESLARENLRCAALCGDNSPEWVIADLACLLAGVPQVPLPAFFTGSQLEFVLESAGVDAVLGRGGNLPGEFLFHSEPVAGIPLWARPAPSAGIPAGTAKVTFTSGTTGTPKGVCLSQEHLEQVAAALSDALSGVSLRHHLCVLPLPVLLENVAGVYAGLLAGAEIILPGCAATGLSGSSAFNPATLLGAIREQSPDSLILLPQMLKAMVAEMTATETRLNGLAFVAVGGARTAPDLIRKARALGLPVYEGYGLSECGSVVSLNTPDSDRPGSVGKPLAHQELHLADDGEIEIRGPRCIGYLGQEPKQGGWYSSGDRGLVDEDGYLHVKGRAREVLITSFGRNVSPEWVESELLSCAEIFQVMVLGDDLPGLLALVVPTPGVAANRLEQAIGQVNESLPDYARIMDWRTVSPFSAGDGQLTPNGRPKREALLECHQALVREMKTEFENDNTGARYGFLPDTY